MPRQLNYKGAPTAKSVLFALWESGFDDDNSVLAEELGVSALTVKSYRVEWKAKTGQGVKPLLTIVQVKEEDVPFETMKGWVWCVPMKEKLQCENCPRREECRWWVCRGGYLGCEEVFEEELW